MTAITHDGRSLRLLTLLDEFSRECLAIRVARRLGRYEVIEAEVMKQRGVPKHIRSDNGPGFLAMRRRQWLCRAAAKRCASNRAVPGRTATAKASMGG
jgi:putative transposase